ncbi:MAG: tetratricopeptide repeat protein [Myxococcaceae bacterium]
MRGPGATLGAALLLLLGVGCAHALREPGPQPIPGDGKDPSALLAEARASFDRRPDASAVRQAESLFLAAAAADPRGIEGLYGAIFAKAWLIEHESDPKARAELAASAVQAGQWCEQRAPASAVCDYALAIGLGLQARESPSTALDALKLIVGRLERAAALNPKLDFAGPARLLALVLLRAPGWPLGPGDPESALAQARTAASYFPDHPPNQLTLAEALIANGSNDEGRAAAQHALRQATGGPSAADPDAPDWIRQAQGLIERASPR